MESQHQPNERTGLVNDMAQSFFGDIVAKNNQNTMLLDRVFKATITDGPEDTHDHKMIGLQGESRVFLFDCGRDSGIADNEQAKEDNRREQCRGLLLKLYVAPIIRIAKIGSTFFSVLDNATYACLLLLFFGRMLLGTKDTIGNILDGSNLSLIVTVCSDLLHNIMHASTRLWNLRRVDVQLVLVLYVAYYINLVYDVVCMSNSDLIYVCILSFRFGAFYLTTSCDYWVDMLVLNTLMKLKQEDNLPCL